MNLQFSLLASIIDDPSNETARLAFADLMDDGGKESFLREKGYFTAIPTWNQNKAMDIFWVVSLVEPIKATHLGRISVMTCHYCKNRDVLIAKGSFWSCNRSGCNPLYHLNGTLSLHQQINPDKGLEGCLGCNRTYSKTGSINERRCGCITRRSQTGGSGTIGGEFFGYANISMANYDVEEPGTIPTAYWRNPQPSIVEANLETFRDFVADTQRAIIDSVRIPVISPGFVTSLVNDVEPPLLAATDLRPGDMLFVDEQNMVHRISNGDQTIIGIASRYISQGEVLQWGLDIIRRGGTTVIE